MFRPETINPAIKRTDIPQRFRSRRRKSRVTVQLDIA